VEKKVVYQRTGLRTRTVVYDPEQPNQFGINTELVCDPIVETNRALSEEHPRRSTNKLLARAPMTVYEQSIREGWDESDWTKWLNDPDNAAFRVWKGRV
jgi:hypothetical protein